jgi:hypothetical protein
MKEDLLLILKLASNYQMIVIYLTFLVGCLIILRIQRPPKSALDKLNERKAKAKPAKATPKVKDPTEQSDPLEDEDLPLEDE